LNLVLPVHFPVEREQLLLLTVRLSQMFHVVWLFVL